MEGLLAKFSIETILIISITVIGGLIKLATWCYKMYQAKKQNDEDNINQGRQLEQRKSAQEERFTAGEARIAALEKNIEKLTEIINKQQQSIDILIASDELDIKTWIKSQHEKWTAKGYIDNYTFDLLEQRYAIYTKEGGNSWAKKLMGDLRHLPVVAVIPISEIHAEQKSE